jgi:ABC-type transport system involved in cytochrome c biogenesis permease subunit
VDRRGVRVYREGERALIRGRCSGVMGIPVAMGKVAMGCWGEVFKREETERTWT